MNYVGIDAAVLLGLRFLCRMFRGNVEVAAPSPGGSGRLKLDDGGVKNAAPMTFKSNASAGGSLGRNIPNKRGFQADRAHGAVVAHDQAQSTLSEGGRRPHHSIKVLRLFG